jgi:hypothetical protein
MTSQFLLGILTFITVTSATFAANGQVLNNKVTDKNKSFASTNLNYDSSKMAIIEVSKKSKWPFDSTFSPSALTQKELAIVDSFLSVSVQDYNSSLDKDHKQWGIDLKNRNYRKQLMVAKNKNGQKEVWVNCFCAVTDNYAWRTNPYEVEDGGNCYFNFKVNLSLNKYYNLMVNGK